MLGASLRIHDLVDELGIESVSDLGGYISCRAYPKIVSLV